jgi:hypothetical protein
MEAKLPGTSFMVRVHIYSARETEPVAVVEAYERSYRITGPCSYLLAPDEATLGLPSGRAMTAADDPEQWARGLILRYRSPDLAARIVHDDAPLPEERGRITAPIHALR